MKIKKFNENLQNDVLDARTIVLNILKMYNLSEVERNNDQLDLAHEIINDLVNADMMK